MESHGIGGEIQVTRATYEKLVGKYVLEPRGPVAVKGKGEMETWFLKERLLGCGSAQAGAAASAL
jgi:hypothetical protein